MVVICPPKGETKAMYPSMLEQVTLVFGTSTATSLVPHTCQVHEQWRNIESAIEWRNNSSYALGPILGRGGPKKYWAVYEACKDNSRDIYSVQVLLLVGLPGQACSVLFQWAPWISTLESKVLLVPSAWVTPLDQPRCLITLPLCENCSSDLLA
jgi:hypothetical protein